MAELQALCMKCREEKKDDDGKNVMTAAGKPKMVPTKQTMNNVQVTEKDGRYSAKGTCGQCGGNMFKFMSKDDAQKHM